MAKRSLEEDLADFILGMQPGPDRRRYFKRCMELWREVYGALTAEKVRNLVITKLKDK